MTTDARGAPFRSSQLVVVVLSVVCALLIGCVSRPSDTARPATPTPASRPAPLSHEASAQSPALAPLAADDASIAVDAQTPATSLPRPETSVEWAKSWLDALRGRDLAKLGTRTSYPFKFDDTGAVMGCKAGRASANEELAGAVACLLEDELLAGALRANPEPLIEQAEPSSLPRWAKRWRKEMRSQDALVTTTLADNGISYFLVLVTTANGVRSVLRHAEFWPN